MTDEDRMLLQRADRLLSELKAENWRRDIRMDVINRRVVSLGNWLIVFAYCALGLGVGHAISQHTDVWDIVAYVIPGLLVAAALHGAAKRFLQDPLDDHDRRELNAERAKDGLEPIRESTIWDLIAGLFLFLVIGGAFMGIVGGVCAVVADLVFFSKSFGVVAQWGAGAFVASFLGLGLMLSLNDWKLDWRARREAARKADKM